MCTKSEADITCDIEAIEKRRDGGTRYWCRTHRADATEKYGKQATKCKSAESMPIIHNNIPVLDLDKYLGGVAMWGAAPAIYDTTRLPIEQGIHVHARLTPRASKEIDFTYDILRIVGKSLPSDGIIVNQLDAIYFLISSVFGFSTKFISCTYCSWPHLDMGDFSVYPHRKHLCSGCGRHFHDKDRGIGNPIIGVRRACGVDQKNIRPSKRKLNIRQSDYIGGIQIWGSNPAFLWTQHKDEESGIHVHAYRTENSKEPEVDETFEKVVIDGVTLDPEMVRILMAQSILPSLSGRVQSAICHDCKKSQFGKGEEAFTPSNIHICDSCGASIISTGRLRKVVLNPLIKILDELAVFSPRPPQNHKSELLLSSLC